MTIREAGKGIVRKSYGGEKIHIELDLQTGTAKKMRQSWMRKT